ncbi:G protein-coupled glucose receptor regulating Gpa2-domain-containing protein [Lipomyces japonicus]|uniref:G protein-coupled glucose receptor regulating Gpa2-domain-containing protein n=1 Tax=Lipomyces japonicus TaxID=56871 RepID=UPI0034CEE1BA
MFSHATGMPDIFVRTSTGPESIFSEHDRQGIRLISFVASTISIISCLLTFYWYIRMERKVFRHTLLAVLLFFDFWRAVILFWYPLRLWYASEDSIGAISCQANGFLSAFTIEASDYGILVIAIHTVMFIMYPQVGSSSPNLYGGLYKYRKIIYVLWFVIPAFLAALAFVDSANMPGDGKEKYKMGYVQLTTWCYLPVRPIWYRLALAWIPRYLVLLIICAIYVGLYLYVRRVLRQVNTAMKHEFAMPTQDPQHEQLPDHHHHHHHHHHHRHDADLSISPLDPYPFEHNVDFSTNHNEIDDDAQFVQPRYLNNVQNSSSRQDSQIERQVKLLLLYPIFYMIVWTGPFVNQLLFYFDHFYRNPVVWLSYLSAFMYAISGVANTIIFAIREKPWQRRQSKIAEAFDDEHNQQQELPSSWTNYLHYDHHNSHTRRNSQESIAASFEAARRQSEISLLSIEGLKTRFAKIFRRSEDQSETHNESTTAPPTTTVIATAAAGDSRPRIKTTISKNTISHVNSGKNTGNATVTTPSQIRSPYDIMKVEPSNARLFSQEGFLLQTFDNNNNQINYSNTTTTTNNNNNNNNNNNGGTVDWWDRLEELQSSQDSNYFNPKRRMGSVVEIPKSSTSSDQEKKLES